ncbi:MAG: CapA family protein, partial [Defluviitaleaceae bacterium]|nr:CapA family protein [Defluviitaleaceae bacterium]
MSRKKLFIISFSSTVVLIAVILGIFVLIANNRVDEYDEQVKLQLNLENLPEKFAMQPEWLPEPSVHFARLAFVGDIMVHQEQLNAARVSPGVYDFNYKFRYIYPFLQGADFTLGNLETTLVPPHRGFAGWPLFRTPASMADALINAGFDMVTTGNNHSFDDFVPGVR